ncbi:MAG: C1 family peptidase, partial [Treponema sp.]|nr:C1 family peptidase [Treponema sp.]
TANAAAGAYEYLLNRNQGVSDSDVSRLFLYYNTRVIEDCVNLDEGALIQDVLTALNKEGICNEKTWPYTKGKVKQKPSKQAYEEAQKNKISKYERLPLKLESWKTALAKGYPIIFGIMLYESFQNPRNGRISMPARGEKDQGGHAMCCVGYSDPDRVFIVRNSWGHQWGDGGYCYIPYDYMMNPKYNDGDSWVIYDVNPIEQQAAEETWEEDSESIFVDMENEFSDMSDEDWYAMCEELGDYDIVFRLGALYNIACWGDEQVSKAEAKVALEKLKNLLIMFGLNYSPKKVMKHCENIWVNEDDDFFENTVAILSKYLSEGARATIAADMLEICNADDDAADDERDVILALVGDWLNDDLILAYYADYLDEDDYDDYDYYDDEDYYYDEDDYYYDADYGYDDYEYNDDNDYDYDYY